MRSTLVVLGAIVICITYLPSHNNGVEFKFSNAICESYNKSWVIFSQCRIYAVSRSRNTLNINVTFLHPTNSMYLKMQVLKKASGYKPWILKASIDACKFLKTPNNPLAKIVYGLFREFTNANHTCPYMGVQLIQGFYLRPELLRLPFPTGEYLLTMLWSFDKRPLFSTNVYFVFKEDY